jgi:hypothetical protein
VLDVLRDTLKPVEMLQNGVNCGKILTNRAQGIIMIRKLRCECLSARKGMIEIMGRFEFKQCADIEGLYAVQPYVFEDARGYNFEAYNEKDFMQAAHGFLVLSDIAEFEYKLSDFYHPEDESGIPWNDERLGIQWPVAGMQIITSERDSSHRPFSEDVALVAKKAE